MTNKTISLAAACLAALAVACAPNQQKPETAVAMKAEAPARNTDGPPTTTIEFEEMEYDFGIVNEGDRLRHTFKFRNTGEVDLQITSVKGSGGGAIPDEWPREPIPPGESGEIKISLSNKGRKGKRTKTFTIVANTDPNPTRLTIKAYVTPADDNDNAPSNPGKKTPASSGGK